MLLCKISKQELLAFFNDATRNSIEYDLQNSGGCTLKIIRSDLPSKYSDTSDIFSLQLFYNGNHVKNSNCIFHMDDVQYDMCMLIQFIITNYNDDNIINDSIAIEWL